MKTDSQIRRDVIDEWEWEPSIDASQLRVAASAGVITLTDALSRYTEKMKEERLAKSLASVKVAWAAPGVVAEDNALTIGAGDA